MFERKRKFPNLTLRFFHGVILLHDCLDPLPVQMSSWPPNIRPLFIRFMCCKTFDPFSIFIRTAVFPVITYFPMCSYHDKGPIKILATSIFFPHKRVHNATVTHKASDYFISVRWLSTMFGQGKRVQVSRTSPIRYTLEYYSWTDSTDWDCKTIKTIGFKLTTSPIL